MRIILTILLFFALSVQGQYTKHIVNSGSYPAGSGYPAINNVAMAFGVHLPPPNPNGRKHMIIIFLHGQGERGPRGDTTTVNGLTKVFRAGLAQLVATQKLPRFVRPSGGVNDSLDAIVLIPQCSSEFGTWPVGYESEMIKYAKVNLANVGDTNMIVVTGLSQGGGGTMGGMANQFCNENTSVRFAICPGYYAYTNRQQVADWGQPFYGYFAQNDPTASIVNMDGMVTSTNAFRPVAPWQYIRFLGTTPGSSGHNIWDIIYTTTRGGTYVMSNGDTYVHRYTIYELAAQYTKQRPKRN